MYNMYISTGKKLNWKKIELADAAGSLPDEFLDLLTAFFESKRVSLSLVCAVICWFKSVVLLQGNGFLTKTVYMAMQRSKQLQLRIQRCLSAGLLEQDDKQLATILTVMKSLQEDLDNKHLLTLCRSNPYLAGACVLDRQFIIMEIGCQSLMITSRFRAFGHLYNAMRDRKLIDSIPFADKLLDIYDRLMFYPSRPGVGKCSMYATVEG